nr:RidA family protein [Mesorhizobium sp. CA16]
MDKEVIEVPVMSAKVRSLGLPCSTAVRANGFVFISATPPVDMATGEMVRGDIETQTEASLKALKHCLEAGGSFSVNPPARSFVPGRWSSILRSSAWWRDCDNDRAPCVRFTASITGFLTSISATIFPR